MDQIFFIITQKEQSEQTLFALIIRLVTSECFSQDLKPDILSWITQQKYSFQKS